MNGEADAINQQLNAASKEIGALMQAGSRGEAEAKKSEVAGLKDKQSELERQRDAADAEMHDLLSGVPNIPADDVPVGADEAANVEVRRWGNPREIDFEVRDHVDLGEQLRILVLERAMINARDALGRTGTVTVRARNLDGAVELVVADDGCGMSEDVVQQIFEPFFTTKASHEGTGLDLATVYGVVQRLQGSIDVASAVGEGTTFTIRLPTSPARAAQAATPVLSSGAAAVS